MRASEIIKEIAALGWEVRTETELNNPMFYQAFFRGWQTPWKPSLSEVLKDVQAYQQPEAQP